MRPFTVLVGKAAPLPAANVDTDVIIRIDRLTEADWSQIGRYAFESLRYDAEGREEAAFVLNQPAYRGAPILVAGTNFGCGSSREPAVTAILAAGIRCVIADSFGDIFYANCFRNGLLPVRLAPEDVDALSRAATAEAGPMTIDLAVQTIVAPDGRLFAFDVDRQSKAMLLEGLDEIGLTLKDAPAIAAWQAADRIARPWVWLDDAPAPTRPLTGGNNGSMGDDGHA